MRRAPRSPRLRLRSRLLAAWRVIGANQGGRRQKLDAQVAEGLGAGEYGDVGASALEIGRQAAQPYLEPAL